MKLFVTCARGLEELLQAELTALGGQDARQTVAGVHVTGDLALAYRACLWSRLGSRVLLPLAECAAEDADGLYQAARTLPWEEHFAGDCSLAVSFLGSSNAVRHTQFGAQRIKDGIVDRFREREGRRPSVDREQPQIRINAVLRKGRLTLSLDLSGQSLHRRGWRTEAGAAPLKESLAAALLLRAGWPAMAAEGGALLDPMCGAGTLLIEGACLAADIAPGLCREQYGFGYWKGHDPALWETLREEAVQRREAGLARLPRIQGYDSDPRVVRIAQDNLRRAGLEGRVQVDCQPLEQLRGMGPRGLLLTNPPYGVRLGDEITLKPLYATLGARLREHFPGWRAGVFTASPELCREMGLHSVRQYALFNGSLPSKLLMFDINPEHFYASRDPRERVLSGGAEMFANRLRKNRRKLAPWLKRDKIECYRLYDADMPEYAVAVDIYGEWVHVQEYAAPASVDADAASRRLREVLAALPVALEVPPERIVVKERRRQRGTEQYVRQAARNEWLEVREGSAKLWVNLHDYLDTGLFLDHRPVRLWLGELARGKRFLNLFCYTATASVHAALGGAASSLSVDMSSTYLDWARRNYALNGLNVYRHRLERADALGWLKTAQGEYDLIFLDPPTFSNSKRTENVLDVQRDHVAMIRDCLRLLAPGGLLVFSNNYRRFRLDTDALADCEIEDITPRTLDPDFQGNPRIHQCWTLRPRAR